jgi:hypothetical protein
MNPRHGRAPGSVVPGEKKAVQRLSPQLLMKDFQPGVRLVHRVRGEMKVMFRAMLEIRPATGQVAAGEIRLLFHVHGLSIRFRGVLRCPSDIVTGPGIVQDASWKRLHFGLQFGFPVE